MSEDLVSRDRDVTLIGMPGSEWADAGVYCGQEAAEPLLERVEAALQGFSAVQAGQPAYPASHHAELF